MNLSDYYWYFKSAIPAKICDRIVETGLAQQDEVALTGGLDAKKGIKKKELLDLKKLRISNVAWLNNKWIYKAIQPYIHEANRNAGWNFDWDYSETCQFTKYKKGQHYGWHCDAWPAPYGVGANTENLNKNTLGKIRKLSVTVSLSDDKDYNGGDLEFDFRNGNPDKNQIDKSVKKLDLKVVLLCFKPCLAQSKTCNKRDKILISHMESWVSIQINGLSFEKNFLQFKKRTRLQQT